MKSKKQKVVSYILVLVSILVVAILGSVFVNMGKTWFAGLQRPTQFVPDVVIPIVWTIIYSLFAIVLCVWLNKEQIPAKTIALLVINAVFNILWCLIFFALNQTLGGLIVIILLVLFSYLLIIEINNKKPIYSYILSLYPIWASIATCLNLALWILN